MQLSNKIRFVGLALLITVLSGWVWVCDLLMKDYLSILTQEPIVRLSVITLWVPFGVFGVLLCLVGMSPKALFYGKKINEVFTPSAMKLANKVCLYFALSGIAFAVGWTYHSLDLLDKYGYVYSRDLTKITPTGIHLMYIKSR